MSSNRDLARSLLAAARRHSNRFKREQEREQERGSQIKAVDDQGPQLLNQAIAELIATRGWSEKVRDSDLFLQWAQLVGVEIADHVQPIKFHNGELTLSAESTAWAVQIRLIESEIRAKLLSAGFSPTSFTVVGPRAPSWQKGGWRVKGRGPRDTYG